MNRTTYALLLLVGLLSVHCAGIVVQGDDPVPVAALVGDAGGSSVACSSEPLSCGSLGGTMCWSANPSDRPAACPLVGVYDGGEQGPTYWCCPNPTPAPDPCALCTDLTTRCSDAASSTLVSCPASCALTPATWYGTDATQCSLVQPSAGNGPATWCCS